MTILQDSEFGAISVVRRRGSVASRLRLSPNGQLRVTVPNYLPLLAVKALIHSWRPAIRQLLQQRPCYDTDQPIGKSHYLHFQPGQAFRVQRSGTQLIVRLPAELSATAPMVQQAVRATILKALRREASHYLPRRLRYLADQHGFCFQTVTLTHASSRWGSCSARGTISLNIALMQLPFELLDYVLLHELCHTQHLHHQPAFWAAVAAVDPAYQEHRQALKHYSPHV